MAVMVDEVRSVSLDELKGGVQAKAGHRLVLVVDGAQGVRPDAALGEARWAESDFEHGDKASMEVDVEHGEGRRVRFILERKDGNEWSSVATVEGTVSKGKASASAALEHPGDPEAEPFADAAEREMRFRCELV
jgi:hypothetical protein